MLISKEGEDKISNLEKEDKPQMKKQILNNVEDFFKTANQSVDELLNEITTHSISSTSVDTDNNIQNSTSIENIQSSSTEPLNLSSALKSKLKTVEPTNLDPLLKRDNLKITGPRTLVNTSPITENRFRTSAVGSRSSSPTKKTVKIQMAPPQVLEYEYEPSEYETSDLQKQNGESDIEDANNDDDLTDGVKYSWKSVPLSIKNDTSNTRALPPITHSASDYSIRSMPNLSKHDDYDTTVSENEESILMSAESTVTENELRTPTDYTKDAKDFMKKEISNTDKSSYNITRDDQSHTFLKKKALQHDYDHETYLENIKRGTAKVPKDIKSNKLKHETFIKELGTVSINNKDLEEEDDIITDLGELYPSNIRNTKNADSLKLQRNDSVRSVMSISSIERKLSVKPFNKKLNNIVLKDGIKGFSDELVEELVNDNVTGADNDEGEDDEDECDDDYGESRLGQISSNIQNGESNNNKHIDVSDNEEETEMRNSTKQLKNSKSLVANSPTRQKKSVLQSHLDATNDVNNSRVFSLRSNTTATSTENESDFVSAVEDEEDLVEYTEADNHNILLPSANVLDQSFSGSETSFSPKHRYNNSLSTEVELADVTLNGAEDEITTNTATSKIDNNTDSSASEGNQSSDNSYSNSIMKSPNLPDSETTHTTPYIDNKDISSDIDIFDTVADKVTKEAVTEDSNTSSNSLGSVHSKDFTLDVLQFDDDPFDFLDDFKEDDAFTTIKRRSGSRQLSSETAHKEDVLAIWQTQPEFKSLHKQAPSFQSICDPKRSFIVEQTHHKQINFVEPRTLLSNQSSRVSSVNISKKINSSTIPDSSVIYTPATKLVSDNYNPVDIEDANLASNTGTVLYKPLNDAYPSKAVKRYNFVKSEADESTVENDNTEHMEKTSNSLITGESMEKSAQHETSSMYKDTDTNRFVSTSSTLKDYKEETAPPPVSTRIQSLQLSDILPDSDDSSFLNGFNSFNDGDEVKNANEKEEEEENKFTNSTALDNSVFSNKGKPFVKKHGSTYSSTHADLCNIWRTGTISRVDRKREEDESANLPAIDMDEMENFLIRKRLASEDFHIKTVNNKAFLQTADNNDLEQKGLMIKYPSHNANAETKSVDTDNVNDLDITTANLNLDESSAGNDNKRISNLSNTFSVYEDTYYTRENANNENMKQIFKLDSASKQHQSVKSLLIHGESAIEEKEEDDDISMTPKDSEETVNDAKLATTAPEKEKIKVKLINGEQGRLFLRLKFLKEFNFPKIKDRNVKFCCVIDNGIHCLTTKEFSISDSLSPVLIDREFELIVAESLDLYITLKMTYDKVPSTVIEVKETRQVKSKNKFLRCFGVKDSLVTKKLITKEPERDQLKEMTATDGSFAKFKVSFDSIKERVNGQANIIRLDGWNEWRRFNDASTGELVRGKPFRVCTLETNMLFVPRTSKYEVLPISIKNAYQQVYQVKQLVSVKHEGYLYQEGGDIDIWQRRFFKLDGYDLVAHNETTMKPRAKINMKKVIDVDYPEKKEPSDSEDDKDIIEEEEGMRVLLDNGSGSVIGGGSSEKSIKTHVKNSLSTRHISETLLLSNGFKLKFLDGETIDFGADSKLERDEWLKIFDQLIAKQQFGRQPWVRLMIEKSANSPTF